VSAMPEGVLRLHIEPFTRALVVVTGALAVLPTDRARQRVLVFVSDSLAEKNGPPTT
jgi:hypothetical protein